MGVPRFGPLLFLLLVSPVAARSLDLPDFGGLAFEQGAAAASRGSFPDAIAARPLRAAAALRRELDATLGEIHAGLDRLDTAEVLRPEDDDALRESWARMLLVRAHLARLGARYPGPAAGAPGPGEAAGAAARTLLDAAVASLVTRAGKPSSRTWKKLDEGDPHRGLPAGTFTGLYRGITTREQVEAREADRRDLAGGAGSLPPDLASAVEDAQAVLDSEAPGLGRARWRKIWAGVKEVVKKPARAIREGVFTWIGDTKYRPRKPAIGPAEVAEMTARLRPGDILIERENWYLSNLFLPGFWPHGILFVGTAAELRDLGLDRDPRVAPHLARLDAEDAAGHPRRVIEAVSSGVEWNSMEVATDADHVAAFRPRVTEDQRREAIARAFADLGKPYDFAFDFATADRLVCTELVYRAYAPALALEPREVMGRVTLPATDLVEKFAREREGGSPELDFVFFLDSDPATRATWFADAAALVATATRSRVAFRN